MKAHVLYASVFIGLIGSTSSARATVITFDDIFVIPYHTALIGSYDGFDWLNVYAENNLAAGGGGGPGYSSGIVSQTNAAFNGSGAPASFTSSSGAFKLNSAYFTGAFATENVVVKDNLGDSKTFQVSSTAPTLETFDWTGVSTVSFAGSPSGGFTQVVVDNITINAASAVPEVSTWAMMLMGFAGLGCAGFRSSRQRAKPAVRGGMSGIEDSSPKSRARPQAPARRLQHLARRRTHESTAPWTRTAA